MFVCWLVIFAIVFPIKLLDVGTYNIWGCSLPKAYSWQDPDFWTWKLFTVENGAWRLFEFVFNFWRYKLTWICKNGIKIQFYDPNPNASDDNFVNRSGKTRVEQKRSINNELITLSSKGRWRKASIIWFDRQSCVIKQSLHFYSEENEHDGWKMRLVNKKIFWITKEWNINIKVDMPMAAIVKAKAW